MTSIPHRTPGTTVPSRMCSTLKKRPRLAHVTVDFSGTTVSVAGGTSGINLGIAEGFAAAGAGVAVMSRSPEKVDAAVTRLQALGAQAIGKAADPLGHTP